MRSRRDAHRGARPGTSPPRAGRPGAYLELVGPDGAGKSSVADALAQALGHDRGEVLRLHWRPMVLPRPGDLRNGGRRSDPARPHDRGPHPRAVSLLLLGYYWLDSLLGHVLRVAPALRSGGLVVMERGWHDMAVDARRYRLDVPHGFVTGLGRLLPKPDLRVVLDGDPAVLRRRKPELPIDELRRQREAWQQLARGRADTVTVDTDQPVPAVVDGIVGALRGPAAQRWVGLPDPRQPRLRVPARPRRATREGLRLYQPSAPAARAAMRLVTTAAEAGLVGALPRADGGPEEVRARLAPHVPPGGTYALLATNHDGRFVARILGADGSAVAHAKLITSAGEPAPLEREAHALAQLAPALHGPVRAPRLLGWDGTVLLTEALRPATRRRHPHRLPLAVAAALGRFWRTTGGAHGDLAPWNLLRTEAGWALVDWEHAREEAGTFDDVLHFLVQAHARLGRPRRDQLLDGVRHGRGWVGDVLEAWRRAAGVGDHDLAAELTAYLTAPNDVLVPDATGRVEGQRRRDALLSALR